jgi:hexosaminidase
MNRFCFAAILLLAGTLALQAHNWPLIPMPVSVQEKAGSFELSPATRVASVSSALNGNITLLNDCLQNLYGFKAAAAESGKGNIIVLKTHKQLHKLPGAYNLHISTDSVVISGENAEGVFYGLQTFIQLLPVSLAKNLSVPAVVISDSARFAYRGLHLDVGRHFMPVSFVKKYIDYLAHFKFNTFHWHLTEDQGWRIEIKRYPKLTEVGAWREGTIIGRYPGTGNTNQKHGGFYTQQEVKEIVAYAKARQITVIPEIELPGHSSAAIAAYPYLSCFPVEDTKIPTIPSEASKQKKGKQVQETWGVFDDVFCAGKDSTFQFLQHVLDEVITLFPSTYIHIGGDECPKENWKRCPQCQARMKSLGLKDEHELQSYFIQRLEKHLNSKKRRIIGWDEILEGGLAPNATVMSWRGEAGGVEAAKQNHDVIMTPGGWCYFDHSQSKNEDSVTIGGYTSVEKVYSYEPVPAALKGTPYAKHVLGAQANVWTEYMNNTRKVEYQVFPRLAALAEVLWSPAEQRNWSSFEARIPLLFKRLDQQGINYSNAFYFIDPVIKPNSTKTGVEWELKTRYPKELGQIYVDYPASKVPGYSIQIPDFTKDPFGTKGIMKDTTIRDMEVYTSSIPVTASGRYAAQLYAKQEGKQDNQMHSIVQDFTLHLATGRNITVANPPASSYPGNNGISGLVNGAKAPAQRSINSNEWCGWNDGNMEAIIEWPQTATVSKVVVGSIESKGSWIYRPTAIEVFASADGNTFTSAASLQVPAGASAEDLRNLTLTFAPAYCRKLKVVAQSLGIIPAGSPGAGHNAWLFVDEIQIF